MSAYSVLYTTSLVNGQPEDISQVKANFDAIATVLNGNIDQVNIAVTATPTITSLVLTQNNVNALRLTGAAAGVTFGGDTNLYRSSAGLLGSDTDWESRLGSAFRTRVGYVASANAPGIQFGTTYDTNLYRASAGNLKTDGNLVASGLYFSLTDALANLYRSGAGVVKTDGSFFAVGAIVSGLGTAGQIQITAGTVPSVTFGSAGDTNLYRNGANVLRTDSSFQSVGGAVQLGFVYNPATAVGAMVASYVGAEANARVTVNSIGVISWGPGGAGAVDTNLYRGGAGILRTDGRLDVTTEAYARLGSAAQVGIGALGPASQAGLNFGSASDTNLYRNNTNYLKTDGSFRTGAELRVFTDLVVNENNTGKVYFGSLLDTNLYRIAAGQLATDHLVVLNRASGTGPPIQWAVAGQIQTTVGAAGGASALPATPAKYLKVADSAGNPFVIPAYNP